MSETSSGNPLEPTFDHARPTDAATIVPQALGYVLYERVGVGGMGEVYRCEDDALERDLAIKVIKAELQGNADAEERFLREARLTGSLQHPGIVPIHQLGRLADGRPYYTMKLIRGRTFADMLRDEPEGPERLPHLLTVVEKVCQAVAYAHSKGVIHRDLKPANVMVGEFGEVQVMDWGLAKELSRIETIAPTEAAEDAETVARAEEAAGLSRAGAALGTPNYMPPEQAAGDWDIVDERADVFALGAILCQVLTGRPPYYGSNRDEILRRARRGDVAEALARLAQCGADAELVQLCRECLAAERENRPRSASVVAERLATYQAEVRERLRQAELQRARAEVKALEERKRRRLLAGLMLAAMLLLAGGGVAWWQWQRRQSEADNAVLDVVKAAKQLREQAQADPLNAATYDKAVAAAQKADDMAHTGGASAAVQRKASVLRTELEAEAEAATNDRQLLAALLDLHGPREGPKFRSNTNGTMTALAEPTGDEQFAAAFRRWGLDLDNTTATEAAARLKKRPTAVVTEVIAALDEWSSERWRQGKPWQRLADVAALLDEQAGATRELRAILMRNRLPVERALDALSAALRPVPIAWPVALGPDRRRLRHLAEQTDAGREPILGLLTLVRALRSAGEEGLAERLLRSAIVARPREVVLHHTLGQLLTTQTPPRWAEAVECFTAARVLRPDLGVNLAEALRRSGRDDEGMALLAWLVQESPKNPYRHFKQAYYLRDKGRLDEEITEYRRAIALDPKLAPAHCNLGAALHDKGRWDEAMDEYHQALALNPKDAKAHNNLGGALYHKGRLDEAIAEYRQAIALNPKDAGAHYSLGVVLHSKGQSDEAIAAYRQAIALDPKCAKAHNNLGIVLHEKGQPDEAIAEFRQAIALAPQLADAHGSLGFALIAKGRLEEAIAEYRLIIALDPKHAKAHHFLGFALQDKGRLDEAIAEYGLAIALDPKDAKSRANLGNALRAKGRLDDAITAFRQAIALDPNDAPAHYNLGTALRVKGRLDEAMNEYRHTIRVKPDFAEAHCNLGGLLRQQGRFAESLDSYRRGHELGSKQPGWRYPSAQWVRNVERLLALDRKLPTILSGQQTPANVGDTLTLAWMCQQPYKKRYAASARLYAEAFAVDSRLAPQPHYNAACSAVLAAAGQGQDAHLLPDKVVVMFRGWALGWLRDDLTAYARLAERNDPKANQFIQQRLAHWRRDADLAAVRDPEALDRLPAHERAAWHALWHNVDELAK